MDFPIGATPVNIVDGLSLTEGTRYSVQVDTGPETSVPADGTTVHVTQAAAAPTNLGTGQKYEHFDAFLIQPESGLGIWAWVLSGRQRATLKVERAA